MPDGSREDGDVQWRDGRGDGGGQLRLLTVVRFIARRADTDTRPHPTGQRVQGLRGGLLSLRSRAPPHSRPPPFLAAVSACAVGGAGRPGASVSVKPTIVEEISAGRRPPRRPARAGRPGAMAQRGRRAAAQGGALRPRYTCTLASASTRLRDTHASLLASAVQSTTKVHHIFTKPHTAPQHQLVPLLASGSTSPRAWALEAAACRAEYE